MSKFTALGLAGLLAWFASFGGPAPAADRAAAMEVPRLQVIPQPYDQASFQREGAEIARYHFGPTLDRPFLYPVIGPAGRPLTRMGHPHDPESHSHHNSVWISHHDVAGVDFWGDRGKGKIRHKRIIEYRDCGELSILACENEWVADGTSVLLREKRQLSLLLLDEMEWLLVIDLEFEAAGKPVTLGKTPFGMIGVRMAKTIGVNDGGGRIRNSEGAVNEKQVFWKPARWVDYSGPVTPASIEGITLFDHPKNPNFPSHFHVRNDGWMGASLTFEKPLTIEADEPLSLRYGLYVHAGAKPADAIEATWKLFCGLASAPQLRKAPGR